MRNSTTLKHTHNPQFRSCDEKRIVHGASGYDASPTLLIRFFASGHCGIHCGVVPRSVRIVRRMIALLGRQRGSELGDIWKVLQRFHRCDYTLTF